MGKEVQRLSAAKKSKGFLHSSHLWVNPPALRVSWQQNEFLVMTNECSHGRDRKSTKIRSHRVASARLPGKWRIIFFINPFMSNLIPRSGIGRGTTRVEKTKTRS